MKAHYLGHVVFYVRDLKRSPAFYRDLLGFKEVGRIFDDKAAALTSGRTHHELLLIETVYMRDPDGNEVEVYIDADPAIWKNDPAAVLTPIKPLRL